jgi:hypothetical protein
VEAATGKVTGACYPRHRHEEFLTFLKQVARACPRVPLHIVCDNYGTHNHPDVRAWLDKHPWITLHFTPTSGSWLNLVDPLSKKDVESVTLADMARPKRPKDQTYSNLTRLG